MSWTLFFFRRTGDGELTVEEVDALFERLPRVSRIPPREEDPPAAGEVVYPYHNPITDVRFEFSFQCEGDGQADAEDPGRIDFPYEETPLQMRLEYLAPAQTAQEAMPVAAEVCQHLRLLAFDAQSGAEIPAPPNVDALIRSYVGTRQEVAETLEFLHTHRRRRMLIALAIFVAGLLMLVLSNVLHRG
jgi:hypothetical protein